MYPKSGMNVIEFGLKFIFNLISGDSGGPMMMEHRSGRYVLLGLVSFGPRTCGVSQFPGVYSRTSAHIDWILNNIRL